MRTLEGVDDAQHHASFLCSLTGADWRRPLGFLTNLVSVKAKMSEGWPSLCQRVIFDLRTNGIIGPSSGSPNRPFTWRLP